jgi:succinate-semialdehyde dehydrogenase/glutarate-semialdehyde dehydrogenase
MNKPLPDERRRLNLTRPDLLRQGGYVAGRWIDGPTRLPVRNPATGGLIAEVASLGAAEAEAAVAAAYEAQAAWAARTAKDRAKVLTAWFDLVMQNQEDLARLMTAEQGKPLAEARAEIAYAAAFLEWFAQEGRRTYGQVIPPHQTDRRLLVTKEPVGVVGAITPWNFPAAMIARKAAPALAAGCAMVLKPSDLTPLSALALAALAEEAGVPAGVFNVVVGDAAPIGEVLTTDPRVAKFTFTGSTPVGKMLAARCMGTVKRVTLELGGNAPFIVLDDADVSEAVQGALASKFRNAGQTCVCANRFYVQAGVYDRFAEELAAGAAKLRVGDGLAGPTDLGPLINQAAVDKAARHVADAKEHGAAVAVGGGLDAAGSLFFQPTVLADVQPSSLLAREETFAPVAGLIRVKDVGEAVALANDSRAGLAAYGYTRDLSTAWKLSEALQYGMVGINTGLISTETAPFGGVKESGIGREGSSFGIDDYLNLKTVTFGI